MAPGFSPGPLPAQYGKLVARTVGPPDHPSAGGHDPLPDHRALIAIGPIALAPVGIAPLMARPDAKSEWADPHTRAVGVSAEVDLGGGRTSRKEGRRRNR